MLKKNKHLYLGVLLVLNGCLFLNTGESNNASTDPNIEPEPDPLIIITDVGTDAPNGGGGCSETISQDEICESGSVVAECPATGEIKCATDCKSYDFSECLYVSQISAGGDHTCTILDGGIGCWGNDEFGQLDRAPSGAFVSVTSGGSHACAIANDKTVFCWGKNDEGQTDAGTAKFKNISAGNSFACGVRVDDTIHCWGNNGSGQSTPPEGRFVEVSAGYNHACGLKTDGRIVCWGNNDNDKSQPIDGIFKSVQVGLDQSCAINLSGGIECWGGEGEFKNGAPPGSGTYSSLSLGFNFGCGLSSFGSIICWSGETSSGREQSPGGSFTGIAVGNNHACAISPDSNRAACWGNNVYGEGSP